MAGSIFGTIYRVTSFGESHGRALGAVIDGCPAGLPLTEEDLMPFLLRRRPGQSDLTTQRKETDVPHILSGTFEGQTTGTPIAVVVENRDQHSGDYTEIRHTYRPGHADYTFQEKYGIRDYRGGGRSSGRETIARVIGGAVAAKALSTLGIHALTFTRSVGPVRIQLFDAAEVNKNPLFMPDHDAAGEAEAYIRACREHGDSAGGVIECHVTGLPTGLGEPVFDKLDAELAKAVVSIGAVKGFEIGDGFGAAELTGSTDNDPFRMQGHGVEKLSNHAGGTLGGMSDGSELIVRAAVKPTPSISSAQETVTDTGENTAIEIKGRHDPVIVPRAVVVVESMVLMTVFDMLLRNMPSKMTEVRRFYGKQ